MRAVIQRVSEAAVRIDGEIVSKIGPGLLILLGVEEIDDASDVEWLSAKIAKMRIFSDGEGKMNLAVTDTGGEVLVAADEGGYAATAARQVGLRVRVTAPFDERVERVARRSGMTRQQSAAEVRRRDADRHSNRPDCPPRIKVDKLFACGVLQRSRRSLDSVSLPDQQRLLRLPYR